MFTGIVEGIGTISSINHLPSGSIDLTITDCAALLTDAHLGDSISINGVCLTIISLSPSNATPTSFTVSLSPETLRRSSLSSFQQSSHVNLERAVLASTRMGGHFVQGHVDTVATISSITPDGDALVFRLQPRKGDERILKYIVEKGYVTLDGTSLTVTRVEDGDNTKIEDGAAKGDEEQGGNAWWEVMLITYTQEKVVLAEKKVGEEVNVEVDMVGKYVEKSLQGYLKGLGEEGGADRGGLERIVEKVVARQMRR